MFVFPLFQTAITCNDERILRDFIHLGLNPNGLIHYGTTPLTWAICCRQPNMIRVLIEHGVDVNVPGLRGCSPLFKALREADSVLNMSKIKQNDDDLTEFLQSIWDHDRVIAMLLAADAETLRLTDLEFVALSKFHDRQKAREALGICTGVILDSEKMVESKSKLSPTKMLPGDPSCVCNRIE